MTEEVSLEPAREDGEFTTILYQEQVEDPGNPFYTETIVTGSLMCGPRGAQEEVKDPPLRIKNKRTVAAVSSEDKRLALNAMEDAPSEEQLAAFHGAMRAATAASNSGAAGVTFCTARFSWSLARMTLSKGASDVPGSRPRHSRRSIN